MASIYYGQIGGYGNGVQSSNGADISEEEIYSLLDLANLQALTRDRHGNHHSQKSVYNNHSDHRVKHYDYENNISRYAMDAIFMNLIYPDVCQGHFFPLDNLVQNVPQTSAYSHRRQVFHPHNQAMTLAGKRKRSYETCSTTQEEVGKKMKREFATLGKYHTPDHVARQ